MSLFPQESQREPPAEAGVFVPTDYAQRAAVREQLERVVTSPVFRHSKRCPRLLTRVVELALDGQVEQLKERTLGVDVFDRDPDYDTNQYPVVRTTAHEIRKRLAQYYQESGHQNELRIELPAGSYVPEFRMPSETAAAEAASAEESPSVPSKWRLIAVLIPAAAVLVAVTLLAAKLVRPPDALDEFWGPIWNSSVPTVFSLAGTPASQGGSASGNGSDGASVRTLYQIFQSGEEQVSLGDVIALVDITGQMKARGIPFQIRLSRVVEFDDLKTGPVVFLGPMNTWIETLAPDLRFSVNRDQPLTRTWISDANDPSQTWSIELDAPSTSIAETYALVTRVWIEDTGQPVVSIAGLSNYATNAAGAFLSNPDYIEEFAKTAPTDWEEKNIQIVIATTRVGTSSGTPRIVATHVW